MSCIVVSRDVKISRPVSVSRPIFDGLGISLGLGLEGCGLGLDVSAWSRSQGALLASLQEMQAFLPRDAMLARY